MLNEVIYKTNEWDVNNQWHKWCYGEWKKVQKMLHAQKKDINKQPNQDTMGELRETKEAWTGLLCKLELHCQPHYLQMGQSRYTGVTIIYI